MSDKLSWRRIFEQKRNIKGISNFIKNFPIFTTSLNPLTECRNLRSKNIHGVFLLNLILLRVPDFRDVFKTGSFEQFVTNTEEIAVERMISLQGLFHHLFENSD